VGSSGSDGGRDESSVGREDAISHDGLTLKDLKGPKPVTSTWISRICSSTAVDVVSSGRGVRGPASPIVALPKLSSDGSVVFFLALVAPFYSTMMQ